MPHELPPLDQIRRVHLIAIAGTAMGSLACMLAARGLEVTGSDGDIYPPMSDQLRDAGIPVSRGFDGDRLREARPDLVVIGNAVRRDNPEAMAAIEGGLPYASLPAAVRSFFIEGKHSVVVTGTHGKTTTTSLIGWILTAAGLDPSVLVGGVAENFGGSFRLGAGDHFVIEGDEYDTAFFEKTPKFLHYNARTVLLTSCEFDHADIYASLDEIQAQFRKLVEGIPRDGRIVAATDAQTVRDVLVGSKAEVEGYGFTEGTLWRPSDVAFDSTGTQFSVWRGEERVTRARIPMFGRHNVENALGAIAVCRDLGVDPDTAAEALANFAGVRRRQQVRGEAAGMTVIDDFAHHPTAVAETIAAMRARFPERVIWAVFEPRTNTSRRRWFEEAYVDALSAADCVVVGGVYRAEQIPEDERMRPERVVAGLVERGVDAVAISEVDEIVEHLASQRSGADVALIMSNGDFGGIWDLLLNRLRKVES